MSDNEGVTYIRATTETGIVPVLPLASSEGNRASSAGPVSFTRTELREIMGLYGRRVAEGEWRDYAMDFNPQKAIFAVFRRASERPLYLIEKEPARARRQGAFSVSTAQGLVLRRGHDLRRVLSVLEKKPTLVAL